MKYFFCIFIFLYSLKGFSQTRDIVAVVNNKPITMYELDLRRKIMITENRVNNPNFYISKQSALEYLIKEEVLNQYAEKEGIKIADEEIDKLKKSKDDMNPTGEALDTQIGQDMDNLRKEAIRSQILRDVFIRNYIGSSVSISSNELNSLLMINGYSCKDFYVKACVFTSFNYDKRSIYKMKKLSHSINCNKIDQRTYSRFADVKKIECSLKELSSKTRSVIMNTEEGKCSSPYEENKKLKLVLVYSKVLSVPQNEIQMLKKHFLNQKIEEKFEHFVTRLKSKAYIQVLL